MAERTKDDLPHDLAAERALLGAVLLSSQWGDSVLPMVKPAVSKADFYHPAHGLVFDAICAIDSRSSRGERVDVVTVCDELRKRERLNAIGGSSYVNDLIDAVATTQHAEHHARIVADCAQRRRVIVAAQQSIERARRGGQTWAGDVSRSMTVALDSRADAAPVLAMRDRVTVVLETIARRVEEKNDPSCVARGLSTGINALDRMTPGGLLPGQLIILAGRPGLGKTSLFLQIALKAAAQRGRTLLFSLEMGADELVERALCAEASIDSATVADGDLDERQLEELMRVAPRLERLPVVFDPRSRLKAADIRARVLQECAREKLALVGVDYLQLMEQDGDEESREEAFSRMTRELKLLAKEAGVPIVLLSQFNRANERDKRAPKLSDLRGSGAIEQDADKVWMIHAESEVDVPAPDVDIIIGKQRNGPRNVHVPVRFVRALTKFIDREENTLPSSDYAGGEW